MAWLSRFISLRPALRMTVVDQLTPRKPSPYIRPRYLPLRQIHKTRPVLNTCHGSKLSAPQTPYYPLGPIDCNVYELVPAVTRVSEIPECLPSALAVPEKYQARHGNLLQSVRRLGVAARSVIDFFASPGNTKEEKQCLNTAIRSLEEGLVADKLLYTWQGIMVLSSKDWQLLTKFAEQLRQRVRGHWEPAQHDQKLQDILMVMQNPECAVDFLDELRQAREDYRSKLVTKKWELVSSEKKLQEEYVESNALREACSYWHGHLQAHISDRKSLQQTFRANKRELVHLAARNRKFLKRMT